MKSKSSWRLFVVPAVLALVGYVLLYGLDEWLRTHRGPWRVHFFEEPGGTPALKISHPHLGLSNITVRFVAMPLAATSGLPAEVWFNEPLKAVPFGETAFDDLMYQPGTVVLHCFGHEVQMLPRGLFLNRREHPWQSGQVYDLRPEERLPSLEPPPSPVRRAGARKTN